MTEPATHPAEPERKSEKDQTLTVEYGVEIRTSDHPRADWFHRYGWYAGDEGLERMKESMAYALASGEIHAARLVQRTTSTYVMTEQVYSPALNGSVDD